MLSEKELYKIILENCKGGIYGSRNLYHSFHDSYHGFDGC